MFKRKTLALAVGGVALFSGCAAPSHPTRMTVEPVMAVRNGGLDAERMYRIGRQYQGQQRLGSAEEAFVQALALDAHHAEARNALAVTYYEQGLIRKAEQEFKLAIAAAPTRAHLHNNLGYLYQQIGRDEEAISAFRAALLVDPDNQRARDSLAALTCGDKSACNARKASAATPAAPAAAPEMVRPSSAAVVQPDAPTVALASVAPNVWELQPIATSKPSHAASASVAPALVSPAVAGQTAKALPVLTKRIEVANGNGVAGMAKRVGSYLHEQGFLPPRLTNHRNFKQPYTEVQYVPGAESLARQVSDSFERPAHLVAVSKLERQMPVRLILGKDFNESQSMAKGGRPSGHPVALASALQRK